MREPHWHPETAELGYLSKAKEECRSYLPQEKSIPTKWKKAISILS